MYDDYVNVDNHQNQYWEWRKRRRTAMSSSSYRFSALRIELKCLAIFSFLHFCERGNEEVKKLSRQAKATWKLNFPDSKIEFAVKLRLTIKKFWEWLEGSALKCDNWITRSFHWAVVDWMQFSGKLMVSWDGKSFPGVSVKASTLVNSHGCWDFNVSFLELITKLHVMTENFTTLTDVEWKSLRVGRRISGEYLIIKFCLTSH